MNANGFPSKLVKLGVHEGNATFAHISVVCTSSKFDCKYPAVFMRLHKRHGSDYRDRTCEHQSFRTWYRGKENEIMECDSLRLWLECIPEETFVNFVEMVVEKLRGTEFNREFSNGSDWLLFDDNQNWLSNLRENLYFLNMDTFLRATICSESLLVERIFH